MAFCRNCGNVLPENSKFCGKCGNIVTSSEQRFAVPAAAPMPYTSTARQPMPYYPQKSRKPLAIGTAVVILAVLGGILVYRSSPYFQARRLLKMYAEAFERQDQDMIAACCGPFWNPNVEGVYDTYRRDYGDDLVMKFSDFKVERAYTDEELQEIKEEYELYVEAEVVYAVYFVSDIYGDEYRQKCERDAMIGKTSNGWYICSTPYLRIEPEYEYYRVDD